MLILSFFFFLIKSVFIRWPVHACDSISFFFFDSLTFFFFFTRLSHVSVFKSTSSSATLPSPIFWAVENNTIA